MNVEYDDALEICISKCPNKVLNTSQDVYDFAIATDSHLCRYDIPLEDYKNDNLYKPDGSGPCPALPVYIA